MLNKNGERELACEVSDVIDLKLSLTEREARALQTILSDWDNSCASGCAWNECAEEALEYEAQQELYDNINCSYCDVCPFATAVDSLTRKCLEGMGGWLK